MPPHVIYLVASENSDYNVIVDKLAQSSAATVSGVGERTEEKWHVVVLRWVTN